MVFVVSLICIYSLLLALILPSYIQKKVPEFITQTTTLSLHIGEIRINPFYLSVEINNVNLEDKNKQHLAAFEHLYVNFQLSSLFRQLWYFETFTLKSPSVHYRVYQDHSNNMGQLEALINANQLKKDDATTARSELEKKQASQVPAILVETLQVDELRINFTDNTKKTPFIADIGPLNLSLDNFTTQKNVDSPYSLKATSASGIIGSSFEWQGFIRLLPFRSEGRLIIKDIDLHKTYQYVKDDLPALLNSGKLNLTAQYRLDFSQDEFLFDVDDAHFSFLDIVLQGKGQKIEAVKLGELLLTGVNYSSSSKQLSLDQLALNNSNIMLIIDQQGGVNLSKMLTVKDRETKSSKNTNDPVNNNNSIKKEQELKLAIDKIVLSDNDLLFVDNSTEQASELEISQINMSLTSFDLQKNSNFPVDFSAVVDNQGTVQVSGNLAILPLSTNLEIRAENIPVLSVEQYIQKFIISEIISGEVDLAINLDYQQQAGHKKLTEHISDSLNVFGNFALSNWRTKLANEDKDYARIEKVALDGINYVQSANIINIERMTIDNMWLNARRSENGNINIANIHRPQKQTTQIASEQVNKLGGDITQNGSLIVNLKHFQLNNADILYTDYAVNPRYKMQISPLDIEIKGLSSKVNSRANIELNAKINKFASLSLNGSVNLLSDTLYTNFDMQLNDIQMSDLTPYSGTFIGREIDQGKLNLAINYVIEDDKLKADNAVFIDQLKLGNTVKSEQATSLPIGLAVTLLKDSNQEIHIDMPVSGNLNDPEFSYGQLVWQTFGNLIVKAVSSPFSLLAGLVDSDEDLGAITFRAGSAELEKNMVARLELLRQALAKRPELLLSVTGCFHPADIEIFKKNIMEQAINPDNAVINDSDYLLLLEAEYLKIMQVPYTHKVAENIDETDEISDKIRQLYNVLIDNVQVSDNLLVNLAQQRSRNIQQVLITKYQLPANRLVIGKVKALEEKQALSCALAPQG